MFFPIFITFLLTTCLWITIFAHTCENQTENLQRRNEDLIKQMSKLKQQINISVVRTPNCDCGIPAPLKFDHEEKTYYACNSCLPKQLENV